MSIAVDLADLPERLAEFPVCLVLTNGATRPHLVAVSPTMADGLLRCAVGRSTVANATANGGACTLAFPPADPTGWTLVVDGEVVDAREGEIDLRPVSAVLHRPAVAS